VIGQATNPFIHVSEDFVSYQGLEYRYAIIPVQMDVTPEITRYNVIGPHSNPFVGIAEDFVSSCMKIFNKVTYLILFVS
jgi:hypothetical protein